MSRLFSSLIRGASIRALLSPNAAPGSSSTERNTSVAIFLKTVRAASVLCTRTLQGLTTRKLHPNIGNANIRCQHLSVNTIQAIRLGAALMLRRAHSHWRRSRRSNIELQSEAGAARESSICIRSVKRICTEADINRAVVDAALASQNRRITAALWCELACIASI